MKNNYAIGVTKENFTPDMHLLFELMSGISQEASQTGWLRGNEFIIWDAICCRNNRIDTRYTTCHGDFEIAAHDAQKLKDLANSLNGWLVWLDDIEMSGLSKKDCGLRFVSMDVWLKKFERRVKQSDDR